jgi:hypothetical protein
MDQLTDQLEKHLQDSIKMLDEVLTGTYDRKEMARRRKEFDAQTKLLHNKIRDLKKASKNEELKDKRA